MGITRALAVVLTAVQQAEIEDEQEALALIRWTLSHPSKMRARIFDEEWNEAMDTLLRVGVGLETRSHGRLRPVQPLA